MVVPLSPAAGAHPPRRRYVPPPRAPKTEWRCLQESTLATRAAETKPVQERLVSMGKSEIVLQTGGVHGARSEVREVELYFEERHPARRWVKMGERGTLEPLFTTGPSTEAITPLRPLPPEGFGRPLTGTYPPALPEPPPRRA